MCGQQSAQQAQAKVTESATAQPPDVAAAAAGYGAGAADVAAAAVREQGPLPRQLLRLLHLQQATAYAASPGAELQQLLLPLQPASQAQLLLHLQDQQGCSALQDACLVC
jgi:hypothetical protein